MNELEMDAGGREMVREHIRQLEEALMPGLRELAARLGEQHPGMSFIVASSPNSWLTYSVSHDVGIWCLVRGDEKKESPRGWVELVALLCHGFFSSCLPVHITVSDAPDLLASVGFIGPDFVAGPGFTPQRGKFGGLGGAVPWPESLRRLEQEWPQLMATFEAGVEHVAPRWPLDPANGASPRAAHDLP